MKPRLICAALASLAGWLAPAPAPAAESRLVAFPENGSTLAIIRDGEPYLEIALMGWEPNWKYLGLRGKVVEEESSALLANSAKTASGAEVSLDLRARQTGPRQLTLGVEVSASKDAQLLYVVAAVTVAEGAFQGGKALADLAGGEIRQVEFPLDRKGLGSGVRQVRVLDAAGRVARLALTPPRDIPSDGAARVVLAEGRLAAGQPAKTSIVIDLAEEVEFLAGPSQIPFEPGFEDWYVFAPDADHDRSSEIGMQGWLAAPAGQHGRIQRDGKRLVYNGRPIKLWGLNLCFAACAPEKELAERRAAFYAKYGINAVRLHKYADGTGWAGIQSRDSFVKFDPDALDRMDYLVAALKKRGIYVKLSAHFGAQKLGPADKRHVPYLEEFGEFDGNESRITTPHSAVHYAPELQHVQILQMVNLLQHRNPYTGLTYAEDPAIAFVEIINEQSILFYSAPVPLRASPTLRRHVARRFCQWLREKYGTQERLSEAWGGKQAFDGFTNEGFPAVGERLDEDNILPIGNPWFWDPVQLSGSQAYRKQRLLDTMWFLYGLQNEFYGRYVAAVREAGYQGEIVSSNWQAGRAFSHFCNLHSDALVGTVDRHNYFGGGSGSRIDNATMLAAPGSGMLSAGMQQVADRPFMLSEWIHVAPNEWGVEGPAIVAAYGMGLQGWDVSFMFQNRDAGRFSDRIGRDRWDVTAPNVLGVFPAVARQVLRGDVSEAELLAPSFVHVPSLAEGRLGLEDKVTQQYDTKTFESDKVPAASLAVARCAVEFTDRYRDTPRFDPQRFLEQGDYTSTTGQLRWKPGGSKLDGCFTMDTAATKAVVGFARGQTCRLGNVSIAPECRYAAIYVTAAEPDRDLSDSGRILIVALARARNSGMKVFAENRIVAKGEPPIVMEPVRATIEIRRPGDPQVHVLDHSGRKTGKTLAAAGGVIRVDGVRDKTCYYLVSY